MKKLKIISDEMRIEMLKVANVSKCAHIGSCLSCIDILSVLYFKIMNFKEWNKRDIFILSKAHAALALYTTLYYKKIIDKNILYSYYQDKGKLPAHLDRFTVKGIEVSAGALGHGFNIGLGMAYGYKKQKSRRKVFALLGDGECQEGSIWEGALFAPKYKLNNFTAIIDYNNLQGYGRAKEICSFEPFADKWKAFGWEVLECDGHNHSDIYKKLRLKTEKPTVIIAHTIKGKGVSFMEDELKWHYYIVTDEILRPALHILYSSIYKKRSVK